MLGTRQHLLRSLRGGDQHVLRVRYPAICRSIPRVERISNWLGHRTCCAGVRAVRSSLGAAGSILVSENHLHVGTAHGRRFHAVVRPHLDVAAGCQDFGSDVLYLADHQPGSPFAFFGSHAPDGAVLYCPCNRCCVSPSRAGGHGCELRTRHGGVPWLGGYRHRGGIAGAVLCRCHSACHSCRLHLGVAARLSSWIRGCETHHEKPEKIQKRNGR